MSTTPAIPCRAQENQNEGVCFFEPGVAQPLLWHPTVMEIWPTRRGFPNGILLEQHYYNENNDQRTTQKLIAKTLVKMVSRCRRHDKVFQGAEITPYAGTRFYQPGGSPFNIYTPVKKKRHYC